MSVRTLGVLVVCATLAMGCEKSGSSGAEHTSSTPVSDPVVDVASTSDMPAAPAPVLEPEPEQRRALPEEVGFALEMERAARQVEELDATCAGRRETLSCDPVAWLSVCSRQQINQSYCTRCEQDALCQAEYSPGMPAIALFADRLRSPPRCEEIGWLLSTLEHQAGRKLSDESFAPLLSNAHRPEEFGDAGEHLIALLSRKYEACSSAKASPSPRQRERALAWLKGVQRGELSPGASALIDGEKVGAKEFMSRTQPLLEGIALDRRTPMVVLGADDVETSHALKYAVALQIMPSFRGFLSCVVDNPDACHQFEVITLFLDERDRIIACDMMEQG